MLRSWLPSPARRRRPGVRLQVISFCTTGRVFRRCHLACPAEWRTGGERRVCACKRTFRGHGRDGNFNPLLPFPVFLGTAGNAYVLPRTSFCYIYKKIYDNVSPRYLINLTKPNLCICSSNKRIPHPIGDVTMSSLLCIQSSEWRVEIIDQ